MQRIVKPYIETVYVYIQYVCMYYKRRNFYGNKILLLQELNFFLNSHFTFFEVWLNQLS